MKSLFRLQHMLIIFVMMQHITLCAAKTRVVIGPDNTLYTSSKDSPATPSLTSNTAQQVLFSPIDNVKGALLHAIQDEQAAILVAIFMITDKDIAQALIDAHMRGVHVEIITDVGCRRDKFGKVDMLKKAGIVVYVYKPQSANAFISDIMHHKFVIFEKNRSAKPLLWTGSFNFTKSANLNNQENVLIIDDRSVIDRYKDHFLKLKNMIIERNPKKRVAIRRQLKRDINDLLVV